MSEDVDTLRGRYLVALEAAQTAGAGAITALEEAHRAREVVRQVLLEGRRLSDLEHELDPQPLRASLSAALTELERTRHDAQRLLFKVLQSEGQTLADIGRMWGISRQLVSRMVNEPEPQPSG